MFLTCHVRTNLQSMILHITPSCWYNLGRTNTTPRSANTSWCMGRKMMKLARKRRSVSSRILVKLLDTTYKIYSYHNLYIASIYQQHHPYIQHIQHGFCNLRHLGRLSSSCLIKEKCQARLRRRMKRRRMQRQSIQLPRIEGGIVAGLVVLVKVM